MNQTPRYTRTAVTLHWLIALLMIVNVVLGLAAESLPDSWVRTTIDTHKSIGITVLGLALLRLLWRFSHRPPALPAAYPSWERRLSGVVHVLLYVLIFALPLSGWMHDSAWEGAATHPMALFGIVPWPRIGWIQNVADPATKESLHTLFGHWHVWFGYALYAAFALHLLGALKHQFVDRHAELQRMGW
ncbi:cytochrome b [Solimonas marina]|uniref:Cytochrome b n=1 Tax=Solimonas marina TaxID=2714601 RepID=A0A970B536_9GAMM|nr:cytochrome b [Solimonas marina]NKF22987.1 cytochrome b [Solimonas marina]